MLSPEERKQLERVRGFWGRFRFRILSVVALAAVATTGYGYNTHRREALTLEGSQKLFALRAAVEDEDIEAARAALVGLEEGDFAEQRELGALALAALYFSQGERGEAAALLETVMSESDDAGLRQIAALRRAQIHIDEKEGDAAIALLDPSGEYWPSTFSLQVLFGEAAADADIVEGRFGAARAKYIRALEVAAREAPRYREVLQAKLGALLMRAVDSTSVGFEAQSETLDESQPESQESQRKRGGSGAMIARGAKSGRRFFCASVCALSLTLTLTLAPLDRRRSRPPIRILRCLRAKSKSNGALRSGRSNSILSMTTGFASATARARWPRSICKAARSRFSHPAICPNCAISLAPTISLSPPERARTRRIWPLSPPTASVGGSICLRGWSRRRSRGRGGFSRWPPIRFRLSMPRAASVCGDIDRRARDGFRRASMRGLKSRTESFTRAFAAACWRLSRPRPATPCGNRPSPICPAATKSTRR